MNQKPPVSYPLQFAILIGLLGVFLVISAFLTPIIGSVAMHVPFREVMNAMSRPENADAARWLNTFASAIAFFLPPVILARIVSHRPMAHLGFNTRFDGRQVLLVILITFASMVLSGALSELNEKIPLPATWYTMAKKLEETYKAAMLSMATMRSFPEFLVALLVLAAFPAIFEETLFRGGLQQILTGWSNSKWTAIIVSSILFSAIHFSYFGFLPRTALGIVLGLIFYEGRSIWLNILLHFVNNGIIVLQLYLAARHGKSIEKTIDESMPAWWGLIAVVLLVIFLRQFSRASRHQQGEQPQPVQTENIIS